MRAAAGALPVEHARVEWRRRAVRTAAYFLSFIGLGLTTGSLGPTLSALATQTGVRLSSISYLFVARSLGYVVGSRGGKLFDRLPGNTVLGTTLFLMAAVMAVVPLTSSFWLIMVAMFVLGAAECSLDVGANILLVRSQPGGVDSLLNALHSFFGVGALLSPVVLAAIIAGGYPKIDVYFVLAMMLFPVAALLWYLPTPTPRMRVTRTEKTRGNGQFVFLVALFLFLYVGAEVGFGGWIFTYVTVLKLSTATTAAYLTSGFWAALTVGRVVAIPIARRFSHSSILFVDLAGCLISVMLILLIPHSLRALIAGTCGLGLCMASVFPTLLSYANSRLHLTGQITGGLITGASLGAMLVPLVIGQLFESIGPRVVLLFAVALLIAMSLVMAMLHRASRQAIA